MDLKIKAVKLISAKKGKPEHLIVTCVETLEDGTHREAPIKYDRIPHEDLKKAILALRPHYAVLSGVLKINRVNDEEEMDKFHVSGYTVGGNEDNLGVMITGHFNGAYGATIMNSPFNRFEQPEGGYQLMGALEDAIETIEQEVVAYCDGTKKGVGQQLELEAEEPVTHMQVLPPEKSLFVNEGGSISEDVEKGPESAPEQAPAPLAAAPKRVAQSPENPSGMA